MSPARIARFASQASASRPEASLLRPQSRLRPLKSFTSSSSTHQPTCSLRTLTTPPNPDRRALHTTTPTYDFHFDTHHFVQRLEREGLNRAQAEGIMSAMAEVIDESIRNITSNMVTKGDQEKVRFVSFRLFSLAGPPECVTY